MKKNILLIILSFVIILSGCHFPPELDDVPHIELKNVSFRIVPGPDGDTATSTESILLEFDFEDGDGDVGLGPQYDNLWDFQPYWVDLDVNGEEISLRDDPEATYDPEFWEPIYIIENGRRVYIDTIRVTRNPDHYNLFIKLFIKTGENEYVEFDPIKELRTTFNARIPVVSDSDKSVQGTIRYDFISTVWSLKFPNQTLKLDFYIKDRKKNQSNTVSTEFIVRNLPGYTQ